MIALRDDVGDHGVVRGGSVDTSFLRTMDKLYRVNE
jgi:hypothetical protein